MFDIDQYLDDIQLKEIQPTEELLQHTVKRCEETEEKNRKRTALMNRFKKAALIALPAAAVLAVGIVLGVMFLTPRADAVAYYTVDINPSLCITVDKDGTVTGIEGQNEDAEALLGSLNCVGQSVGETIRQVVAAAKAAGYFTEGQRYVLIGCFGADAALAQSALGDLQAQLEMEFGDLVELLILSGSLDDKQTADSLGVSAGLLKLKQMAGEAELSCDDDVEDLVDGVTDVNQDKFRAPELKVSSDAQNLKFSWNALDFDAMGYVGKVKYYIVAADTSDEITGFSARPLKTVSFYSFGDQLTSKSISLAGCGIAPGETKYFGIWAEYSNGSKVSSNAISYKVPEAEPSATPEPDDTATATPQPSVSDAPVTGHTVTGKISGSNVVLTWGKETDSNFAGYKVVASKTNPSPKYPDDGYLKFITDPDTTSAKLYEGYAGLKADTYYYFSITYLFKDGSTIAANAVKLKVPAADEDGDDGDGDEGDDGDLSGDYVSTNISGYISDAGKVCLSWGKISSSALEGYKVMYSFSDSSPVYGESGCSYYAWITNPATTSCSFYPAAIDADPGQKVYFSITALYDSHSVRKAGNTISLTMPGDSGGEDDEDEYVSTGISGYYSEADGKFHLSWGRINRDTHPEFQGYKVMYSFTNSSPVYEGEDCHYYAWITEDSTTSCNIKASSICAEPGDKVYFSITALYCDHNVRKTGNTISLTVPSPPPPTPTPPPPPTPTPPPDPTPTPPPDPTPTPPPDPTPTPPPDPTPTPPPDPTPTPS